MRWRFFQVALCGKRWLALVIVGTAVLSGSAAGQDNTASAPAALREQERSPKATPWFEKAELTEPLVTDRPDFTESTDAIPRGHFQIEGGHTFTLDREGRTRSRGHTAPETLLRVGVFDKFELRFGWEGYSWINERFPAESRAGRRIMRAEWSQGGSDLYLGFKYKFWEQAGWRPHFGIIPALSAPSGSAGVSSGDADPEIKLAWSYDLPHDLALSGNVNFAVPSEDGRRFFQPGASLSLGFPLLENVGGYVEYFGFYPNARGADCAHALNGGATWRITDNFQIDWRAGFGLNEEADDFFTGVGFAFRF